MHVFAALLAMAFLTPEAPYDPYDEASPDFTSSSLAYGDCVARVRQDPEAGRAAAAKWEAEGGGAAAAHCRAMADLEAGFPKLAAIRLTELGERADLPTPAAQASVLLQAADVWLEANEPKEAENAAAAAQALAVDDGGGANLALGRAFAAQERWQAAVDAISSAEDAGATSIEGFLARARAHQALLKLREAAEDVVAALSINPKDVDALVIRGELAQAGVLIDVNYKRPPKAAQ